MCFLCAIKEDEASMMLSMKLGTVCNQLILCEHKNSLCIDHHRNLPCIKVKKNTDIVINNFIAIITF